VEDIGLITAPVTAVGINDFECPDSAFTMLVILLESDIIRFQIKNVYLSENYELH
jgi:hypothetical protein